MAGLLTINVITLYAYFKYLTIEAKGHPILSFISIKAILILLFAFLVLFYLIYIQKDSYKYVYERFHRESNFKGKSGSYITIGYALFSVLCLFSLVFKR